MRDSAWRAECEGSAVPPRLRRLFPTPLFAVRRPRVAPFPTLPRLLIALALAAACRAASDDGRASDAAGSSGRDAALADTLGRLITDAYDFSRPGVEKRLLGLYAPGAFVVSAAAGRVTTSRAALAQQIAGFWSRVGQNMREPHFVVRERYATALGPDAAALTLTYAIPHQTPEDRPHTLAGAWTAVFQRRGGRWVIVQEHLSDLPAAPAAGPAAAPGPAEQR